MGDIINCEEIVYFVVVFKVIVRDGNISGFLNDINKVVSVVWEVVVIYLDVVWVENIDVIFISFVFVFVVGWRVFYMSRFGDFIIVNVNIVDNDVIDML